MNAGLHLNVPAPVYHSDGLVDAPILSRGLIQTHATRSPLHMRHMSAKLGGVAQTATPEMNFGEVAHQLMLGQEQTFAVWKGADWRGKEAGQFWDAAVEAGKIPLKASELAKAQAMVQSVRTQLERQGFGHFFTHSESPQAHFEATLLWQEMGFWCKARPDYLRVSATDYLILDFKTCECAHPFTLDRKIFDLGYHLQDRWYSRGFEMLHPQLAGRGKFYFVFAETEAPFATLVFECDGSARAIAEGEIGKAMTAWKHGLETGEWPGYQTGIYRGETPTWRLMKA